MHEHLAVAVECHHDTGKGQDVGAPLAQVVAQLFQLGINSPDFCLQRVRVGARCFMVATPKPCRSEWSNEVRASVQVQPLC